ncbi:hypothetical protein KFE25_000614 [Diacronema lutheri]|uniref:EF-hand domain-containing protein n=1 Tax=Diacronema lutheri TaxID=2081491 RepID=A0A8J5XHC8_DIALT|nr:hypothetical protein KFE25_000614 [Diacronema lutheri]
MAAETVLNEKLHERFSSTTAAWIALRSGHGYLDVDGFGRAVHKYVPGLALGQDELCDLLRAYDSDGDGRVSFAEFAAALDGALPSAATPRAGARPATAPAPSTPRSGRTGAAETERAPSHFSTPRKSPEPHAAGKPAGALAQPLKGPPRTPPRLSSAATELPSSSRAPQRRTPPQPPPARLPIRVLAPSLALCRLAADAPIPGWASSSAFFSATRSADELALLCVADDVPPDDALPSGARVERGWRALRVGRVPDGFDAAGVLARVAAPLAAAHVPVVCASALDSLCVCVRDDGVDLQLACEALSREGNNVGYD